LAAMTKTTIILCHPLKESLSHAIARAAVEGARRAGSPVVLHDLYEESFDPVLSSEEYRRGFSFDEQIQAHAQDVEQSGLIVVVHPDWWGGPPAVMKGWIDRVLRPGVAYEFEGQEFLPKEKRGLLVGKSALLFLTTNSGDEGHVAALERLWREEVFGYCGMERVTCRTLRAVRETSSGQRLRWLQEVSSTTAEALT
jgi:putative NADPH-quinone reductase